MSSQGSDSTPKSRGSYIAILVVVWAVVVCAGVWYVWTYAGRPGPSGRAPDRWPADTALRLDPSRPTLLMFIHPRCPCSRASLTQLDSLLARSHVKPAVTTVFVRPPGTEPGWEKQGLWPTAAAIPGVAVTSDPDGAEARRFEVETSGHALLFRPDGVRIFSGGLTSARGHEGDSAGLSAAVQRLRDPALPAASASVYGCLLFARETLEDNP